MFCYSSPLLRFFLSRHLHNRFLLLLIVVVVALPLKLLRFIFFFSASIYLRYAPAFSRFVSFRLVVVVRRWESVGSITHKLNVLREMQNVVVYDRRMDPESSRSLSSLINVVSLLIYRRVAGEPTNEIRRYHARTTLGDTLAGFAR